jgi:hypothetical protein
MRSGDSQWSGSGCGTVGNSSPHESMPLPSQRTVVGDRTVPEMCFMVCSFQSGEVSDVSDPGGGLGQFSMT